jgi:hypothetical protein
MLFLTFTRYVQITLVKDIFPGAAGSGVNHLTPTDYGRLLFTAIGSNVVQF